MCTYIALGAVPANCIVGEMSPRGNTVLSYGYCHANVESPLPPPWSWVCVDEGTLPGFSVRMHELFTHIPPAAGHDESQPFGGGGPPPPSCCTPESPKLAKPLSPAASSPPELLPPSPAAKVLLGLLVPHADAMAAIASAHTTVLFQLPRGTIRETVAAHPGAPVRSASRSGVIPRS